MNFQIGKYVTHPSTGRPNMIKQVRISKGVNWAKSKGRVKG